MDERQRGFSILEVLVATSILTAAIAALAQLFAISTRANVSAKTTTIATVLARQKMEQLRGLTWGFDAIGLPLSDYTTNVAVVPETPTGGTGLTPSPVYSLKSNVPGYCDFLDRSGTSLGGGATEPSGTLFIRRWSIAPLPTNTAVEGRRCPQRSRETNEQGVERERRSRAAGRGLGGRVPFPDRR